MARAAQFGTMAVLAALFAPRCGGEGGRATSGPGSDASADVGSGGLDTASDTGVSGDAGSEVVFVSGPTLTMNPDPNAPLAAILALQTDQPTTVEIATSDGTHTFAGESTDHELTLIGFRPGTSTSVEVTVIDGSGHRWTYPSPLVAEAPPLPADFPRFEVTTSRPDQMEPGYTLLPLREPLDAPGGYLVIVDRAGEVVWYYRDTVLPPMDVRRLDSGHLVFNAAAHGEIVEIDLLGRTISHWAAIQDPEALVPYGVTRVPTVAAHHEAFPTARGFVTLSAEVRPIVGYPTSPSDLTPRTAPVRVGGDVVVEFAFDGTILGEWSLFDLLDPGRVGHSSFNTQFFPAIFGPGVYDWAHANAVIVDPRDDTLIVSSRAQNAVFKFARDGELAWILGPHDNWTSEFAPLLLTPVGGEAFTWSFAQHSPEITASGTLLLFDNGNFQTEPPTPPLPDAGLLSRAVEYAIDESLHEVRQVWQYGAGLSEPLFASSLGDADELPATGNVLVTFGWLQPASGAEAAARIREVTHTTQPEVVFELVAYERRRIYRAEHLPDLYAGE